MVRVGKRVKCIHHFLIDDEDVGTCRNCNHVKVFTIEYINPKFKKRYWEISYETLREMEYARMEIDDIGED